MSIIPKEFISDQTYTGRTVRLRGYDYDMRRPDGEAPTALLKIDIGGRTVTREVAALEGETLGWEGVFSIDAMNQEEQDFMVELFAVRKALTESQVRYTPPRTSEGG